MGDMTREIERVTTRGQKKGGKVLLVKFLLRGFLM